MDYKKELEEALERAKKLDLPLYKEAAEIIFPQLKDSEYEKTRKSLIVYLKEYKNNARSEVMVKEFVKWIKWVEERKEVEVDEELSKLLNRVIYHFINDIDIPYSERDEMSKKIIPYVEQLEHPNSDTIVPLFKVGDWCIDKTDGTVFIITKTDGTYTYRTTEDKEYSCSYRSLETDARLWTIEDAKSGDIIIDPPTSYEEQSVFIFERIDKDGVVRCYVTLSNMKTLRISNNVCNVCGYANRIQYRPATKDERDCLFQKMHESGYEWNAEELKLVNSTLIEKENIDDAFTRMMLKQSNQNSVEWTEADESLYTRCLGILGKCKCHMTVDKVDEELNWFKSLKDKIVSQQSIHNWTEEDKKMARLIGNAITTDEASKYLEEKDIQVIDAHAWLDTLKERTAPQDWNENDSKMSSYIVAALDAYCRLRKERNNASGQEELESAINWIYNRLMYLKLKSE